MGSLGNVEKGFMRKQIFSHSDLGCVPLENKETLGTEDVLRELDDRVLPVRVGGEPTPR